MQYLSIYIKTLLVICIHLPVHCLFVPSLLYKWNPHTHTHTQTKCIVCSPKTKFTHLNNMRLCLHSTGWGIQAFSAKNTDTQLYHSRQTHIPSWTHPCVRPPKHTHTHTHTFHREKHAQSAHLHPISFQCGRRRVCLCVCVCA